MKNQKRSTIPVVVTALFCLTMVALAQEKSSPSKYCQISGVYPHLAMTSRNSEVGAGAVVPWAGRLWVITYGPHKPHGSDDKLYEIDAALNRVIRPESVGGTPANRMFHDESRQLIIGPYFINQDRDVTAIPPSVMPGRISACARALTNAANKVYFFTMEDGVYEVDVKTHSVRTIYPDIQPVGDRFLFGYHGKGAYTAGNRLYVANNGRVLKTNSLEGPSGVLAYWDGSTVSKFGGRYNPANDPNLSPYENNTAPAAPRPGYMSGWHQLEKIQHCEVTGPGGLHGNRNPDDPLWTTGFDKKSVLLQTVENGRLHTWRLPKGSRTADGTHGWHTEWPRIRRLDDGNPATHDPTLMSMHGMFFNFPATFSTKNYAGLTPICDYLKMPVDFCIFNGMLVIGKNDTSKFSNKFAPRSQSNLWFGKLSDLKKWGKPFGEGSLWLNEKVDKDSVSAPFLINGFNKITLHLRTAPNRKTTILIETSNGRGKWSALKDVVVPDSGYTFAILNNLKSQWLRLKCLNETESLTATLLMSDSRNQVKHDGSIFAGLPGVDAGNKPCSDGILRVMSGSDMQLEYATGGNPGEYYRMGSDLKLRKSNDATAQAKLREEIAIKKNYGIDAASAWIMEGNTKLRLPKVDGYDKPFASGWPRGFREVVTERSLLNLAGTFYEVPRASAGGLRLIKPIATHLKRITDFASWRGMLVMTGADPDAGQSPHIVRSDDGRTALWVGEVDDLWAFPEPFGRGGPWKDTAVKKGLPSDPYLMFGFSGKELTLSQKSDKPVNITLEVDFLGDNNWSVYKTFKLNPNGSINYKFPYGFQARWCRLTADRDTVVTAQFKYGHTDDSTRQ